MKKVADKKEVEKAKELFISLMGYLHNNNKFSDDVKTVIVENFTEFCETIGI